MRKRERRHVEKQNIFHVALAKSLGLHRRTDRDHFIRIDALVRIFAKQFFHRFLHRRHARLAADQNHFVDFRNLVTRHLSAQAQSPFLS